MLLALVLQVPLSHASSPAFEQAVQQYKARRYSLALAGFQAVLKTNPSDVMCHYYMALCYQSMNQISQSRHEYLWVSSCSSDPKLVSFASAGLAQLSKYKTTFGSRAAGVPGGAGTGSADVPKVTGRLKVIEFYADW
jgi:hypothetical protein